MYYKGRLKDAIEYLKPMGATKLDTNNYEIRHGINKWTQNNLTKKERTAK